MPGYNNYNPYMTQNQVVNPRINYNQGWGVGYNQMPQQSSDGRVYVNGRAGADAYPIPPGLNEIILWDTEGKRFYIKGYDNNGMPRVLEDNDYIPHTEPDVQPQGNMDLSAYATKEDIKNMIAEAFSNATIPSMVGYVTKDEMDKAFGELTLGNGGRIVRMNESNG